jgi:hypothetical protein
VAGDHPEEERKLKTSICGVERWRRDHERYEKLTRKAFSPSFTRLRLSFILGSSP